MKFTARQIAELLQGIVDGEQDTYVEKLAKIEEGVPHSLSFLANPAYTQYVYTTKASIVIVNESFVPDKPIQATLIRVKDAYQSFAKLLDVYNHMKSNKVGISTQAFISPSAKIGEQVYIGEFAFIGENVVIGNHVKIFPQVYIGDDVAIGEHTTINAGVRLYRDTIIGNHCTLHSGVVLGADGFGFAPQSDQNYKKVAQIGNVVIEDNVEIGANTTIDRATLGSTIIRKGVKLDNLIQIGHNCEIGENTVIAAQTGIAGSSKIGKNCMIAGQVGISGHLNIADNVKIAAQSGIGAHIEKDGEIVQGSPAFSISQYRKSYVHFKNLHDLNKKIDRLEQLINKQNTEPNQNNHS